MLAWPARISRAIEGAWKAGLQPRPQLRSEYIVQAAIDRQGAEPKDGPWRDRLDWLCTALRHEAELNALGEATAYGQLVRIVSSRIRAERLWREHPEILQRPIKAPVAIVGQMRSGTTRMHRLLACDPAFVHTRTFESLEPVPLDGWRRHVDPRPLAAFVGIGFLQRCNPVLAQIHPTTPFAVEEEFGLHAFSLWGAKFEAQWHVPSFVRRCEASDARDVYDDFARLLQTIGWNRGDDPARTWLIKAPQFCQDLKVMIERFPDVRIVRLTRRSEDVVGSSASLAWQQSRIQSDRADPAVIGPEWLRKTALRESRVREALSVFDGVRCDLDFEEVSADWRGAIRRLYGSLGMALSSDVEARMAAILTRPAKHDGHRYALEDFGLDRTAVASALASQEIVRVDIDCDSDFGAPVKSAKPIANDILHVQLARGVDQNALAMATAKH